jgi:aerobic-type carbon monoxide dehydrogenase small subunit (CoxS/CutS family)
MESTIQFVLNGKPVKLITDPNQKLLWVLRTELGLTGTKYGCGAGYCGSCTILLNNEAVRSCQISLKDVEKKEILTIEGLAKNGKLHPIQKAFIKNDALQCGYCTPGMILTAVGLLYHNPNPSRSQIIREMDNNLCRCGSYNRIIEAIETAAQEMREG